jgi:hypothetical protein
LINVQSIACERYSHTTIIQLTPDNSEVVQKIDAKKEVCLIAKQQDFLRTKKGKK